MIRSAWFAVAVLAALVSAQAEDGIVVPAGPVKLAADFVIPAGHGPFPAVVIIDGSTPQYRNSHPALTTALNARGIAVLSYDKRGCGQSTGTLSGATLGDLTDDAAAVTAYLNLRRDVDHRRIGLIGMSQGALIAPAVAVKNAGVRAIVLLGAPYSDSAWLSFVSSAVSYDSAAVLRQVKVPVLALTGSLDRQTPADENLPVIRRALARNPDAIVMELPRFNHIFQIAKTGESSEWGTLNQPGFASPQFLQIVGDWLAKRLR